MADISSGERFHEAVRLARGVISRIREDGKMKDSEPKRGCYKTITRPATREADKLDKYLDDIVQARFDDGVKPDPGDTKDDIPF